MKYIAAIFILAISLFSSSVYAADEVYNRVISSGTIKCGYSPWPPFIVKDPNTGKMSGILYDIVTEIGKSLDLKIEWAYETGYGNYTEDLNSNRIDMMCATLWADPPRIKNSLLIDPFLYTGVYLITRKNDTRFDKDFAKLNNEEFAVSAIDGDITATLANRLFPDAKKILLGTTADPSQLAENVKSKKADATFADLGFFNDYDKKNPGQLKALKQNPAWVFGERMAIKNGETQFKYVLDTAIQELVNSGKIEDIMNKYPATSTWAPKREY